MLYARGSGTISGRMLKRSDELDNPLRPGVHALRLEGKEQAAAAAAGVLGDLHVYDPAAVSWTDLSSSAAGSPPSARHGHGFASAAGTLYVQGGADDDGAPPPPPPTHSLGQGNDRRSELLLAASQTCSRRARAQ